MIEYNSLDLHKGIVEWTLSSVGQSTRLITDRSRVRVPEGPLIYYFIWPSGSVG